MNYIGSKYSLLEDIEAVLDAHAVPQSGTALDLFAGTGAVAQLLKFRGYVTYANDWQYYSYVTNVAFIEHNELPTFKRLLAEEAWGARIRQVSGEPVETYSILGREPLEDNPPCAQVLNYLDQLPGKRGAFYEAYCCGGKAGRMYYARENGLRIQAIRDMIEAWSLEGLVSAKEKAWLVACLVESADRVANTASVYGAYLKHVKESAQKCLSMVALRPIASEHAPTKHQVFCEDGIELLDRFAPGDLRLTYVDPPYNRRQYSSNYHVLETIAQWDLYKFDPRGVTGLRKRGEKRSDFCMKTRVQEAFRQLFQRVGSEYLLFSYNNEGLLSEEELLALFEEYCTAVDLTEIKYKRFRADVDHENRNYKADHTREFLVLGRPKRAGT
jgi:adenine-specific DNA-methyltransferase